MGRAGATRLVAALELHRRLNREASAERHKLSRPAEVFREVRDIRRARKEHLVGLYLDAQNNLIHRETLSIGSLNTTRTHPREILFPAIQHAALGFILCHNHPSGGIEPSPEDLEFTAAVKRAGELMGIELYDHLVVAEGGFTSMRERGLL
jgi:DNA repair protein RadC